MRLTISKTCLGNRCQAQAHKTITNWRNKTELILNYVIKLSWPL